MGRESMYLGNPNVRGADVEHAWTKDELIEYKKCLDSPEYFAKEYCKIIHLDKGLIPFELLGQLIKNNAEIGEKILKLHKSKKEQDKDETLALNGNTNNNVFIGSTAELQKMLRDEIVIDQEPDLFKE